MTRQTHTLLKDILLITIVIMVIVIVASSQSHGQQVNRDSGVLLWGGTAGVSSSTAQSFIDLAGSLTNNFEVVATGTAAATLTTTVVGCMPGGTCSATLASSTGVASQLMTPATSSGPFQTYKVTLSWTGGDATTAFRINRIGVMAKLGGGAGSGTVSPNNGSAGAMATYATNAGSVTVSADQNLIDAANTLTYSASGGFSTKILNMPGATSGTATITPPAVAGTSTNPITISNVLLVPVGAGISPGYSFTGDTQTGMFDSGSNLVFSVAGTTLMEIAAGGATAFRGNQPIGFAAASLPAALDTGISRTAAGVIALGSGAAANESGLLRSGNTCAITADVSLTVNVANSFCSFSLPAVAKAWAFRCDVMWAITAGSGTNTFGLGVNPSQTPTGTTNAEAQVYTATTGTQTMGSTAISASGAAVILTGATYTPAATVQAAKIYGTLLASGTAGTFAIQATAAGTTATAAVKAGSVCRLN